tara:strand:+ start:552 stop:764 length:213 start_codon:yes stop_codon:yes gene_type:complete
MAFLERLLIAFIFVTLLSLGCYTSGWLGASFVMWEIMPFLPELDFIWVRATAFALVVFCILLASEEGQTP